MKNWTDLGAGERAHGTGAQGVLGSECERTQCQAHIANVAPSWRGVLEELAGQRRL